MWCMFDYSFITTKCSIILEWKILLLQEWVSQGEVTNFFTWRYGLPWGRLDEWERLHDWIKREIKEETWRDITLWWIKHCCDFVFDYKNELWRGIRLVFDAHFSDQRDIILSEEHSWYGWFSLEELDKISVIPDQLEVVKQILQSKI